MSLEEIIEGIRGTERQRAQVVKVLYQDHTLFESIRIYIQGHYGTEEDVQVVFDDMIVQLIKTVFTNRDFTIQGPLNAYLMGIAKHIWYAETRKRMNRIPTASLEDFDPAEDGASPLQSLMSCERAKTLHNILSSIGKNCREVLMFWANGYHMDEIAQRLGYQSEGMARKKKSICLKELLLLIESNPQLKSELT